MIVNQDVGSAFSREINMSDGAQDLLNQIHVRIVHHAGFYPRLQILHNRQQVLMGYPKPSIGFIRPAEGAHPGH